MMAYSFGSSSLSFPDSSSPKLLFRSRDESENIADTSAAAPGLLDTNRNVSGLRQRRQPPPPPSSLFVNSTAATTPPPPGLSARGSDPSENSSYGKSKLPRPPPRTSYSLGTSAVTLTPMNDSTNTATAAAIAVPGGSYAFDYPRQPSQQVHQQGCWVCVYGLDESIRLKVVDLLAAHGTIVQRRSLGLNAIAVQYAGPLQASKALCHTPFEVDGYLCGVVPYPAVGCGSWSYPSGWVQPHHQLPQSLFSPSPRAQALPPSSSTAPAAPDAAEDPSVPSPSATDNEADRLFLVDSRKGAASARASGRLGSASSESLCVRLVRWLLSVD